MAVVMTTATVTNSSLSTLRTCPEKFRLMYVELLRPDREAEYFRLGTMFHLCQEMHANHAALADIQAAIQKNYANPSEDLNDDELQAWAYEAVTVWVLFQGWLWRWESQPLTTLAAEQVFTFPIRNPATGHPARIQLADGSYMPRSMSGKIDRIIQWGPKLAVLDYKTTGRDIEDPDFWDALKLDTQPTGYVLGARAMGYQAECIVYDVTRKPTIRPTNVPLTDADGVKIVIDCQGVRVRTKDGKKWRQTSDSEAGYTLQTRPMTLQEWSDKLWQDIQERPDRYYARREIARSEKDISNYRQDIWSQHKLLSEMENNGRFYRNPSACLGRTRCPMFAICTQGMDTTTTPAGFVRVAQPHTELTPINELETQHAVSTTAA